MNINEDDKCKKFRESQTFEKPQMDFKKELLEDPLKKFDFIRQVRYFARCIENWDITQEESEKILNIYHTIEERNKGIFFEKEFNPEEYD